MISDGDIIKSALEWIDKNNFDDSNVSKIDGSILSKNNGKLINTDNLFEDNSLELDNSVGLGVAISEIIKYSGLSSEDRNNFMITEPTAKLLRQNENGSIIEYISSDQELEINHKNYTGLINGLKIVDSILDDSKDYDNQEVTFKKLYPTDNGKLKQNGGRDIPQREIISSDKITFKLKDINDINKNQRKILYTVGFGKRSAFVLKFLRYLNSIMSQYQLSTTSNPSIGILESYYQGSCKFFDEYQIFPSASEFKTITDYCSGKFYYNTSNELIGITNDKDFNGAVYFKRFPDHWLLYVRYSSRVISIPFKSISGTSDGLPMPVQNLENSGEYKYDIIDWKIHNNDLISPYLVKIQLIIYNFDSSIIHSTIISEHTITLKTWNTEYDALTDSLIIYPIGSTGPGMLDLIDDEGNEIPVNLHNNPCITKIVFKFSNDESIIEEIPIEYEIFTATYFTFSFRLKLFKE